jgi:seryl-tRNA(Sec) selenium transferase
MLKVGREEIAGLIAALAEYVERDHAADDARDLAVATEIAERLRGVSGATISLVGPPARPHVVIDFANHGGPSRAAEVAINLRQGSPRVFCADAWIHRGSLTLQPTTLLDDEVEALCERVVAECEAVSAHAPEPYED